MKTLVIGATGFIGKHLVKALYGKGHDVRCAVRKSSNIEDFKRLNVEICYADLLDPYSLKKAIEEVNFIFHCAGEIYSNNPEEHEKINVVGTKNVFDVCVNSRIDKIVYFSSIAATGPSPSTNKSILLNENSPYHPINAYGVSKYKAEIMAMEFFHKNKVPLVILRLPVIYGPGIKEFSRVFLFLSMIRKKIYRVIGKGENLMSLCYIDNLIQGALLSAMEQKSTGKIFLIADKHPYTINEIVQLIAKEEKIQLNDFHIPISLAHMILLSMLIFSKFSNFQPYLTSNLIKEATSNWGCDITRAQKELHYNPTIEFEEGVKKTVAWYMQHFN